MENGTITRQAIRKREAGIDRAVEKFFCVAIRVSGKRPGKRDNFLNRSKRYGLFVSLIHTFVSLIIFPVNEGRPDASCDQREPVIDQSLVRNSKDRFLDAAKLLAAVR